MRLTIICLVVSFASMSYTHHIDNLLLIVDFIYDSVISYPDAPIVLRASKFAAIPWPRISS